MQQAIGANQNQQPQGNGEENCPECKKTKNGSAQGTVSGTEQASYKIIKFSIAGSHACR